MSFTLGDQRLSERFWEKVQLTDSGCWEWTGYKEKGYARFRSRRAHRFAYLALAGEIPAGLVLDHLCRNRACVNPEHLEPVTIKVNSLRGFAPTVVAYRANTCFAGHSLLDAYVDPKLGHRHCRICSAARMKKLNADPEFRKRRAAVLREKRAAKRAALATNPTPANPQRDTARETDQEGK